MRTHQAEKIAAGLYRYKGIDIERVGPDKGYDYTGWQFSISPAGRPWFYRISGTLTEAMSKVDLMIADERYEVKVGEFWGKPTSGE